MKNKEIINFLFEMGMLKRVKHEGWRIIGIDNPFSIAAHSLRAAQIGFFLAKLENYENPYEVVSILIFHDIGECRIGDRNKINNRYVKADEERSVKEQLAPLKEQGEDIFKLWRQVEYKDTEAGRIAKDAELRTGIDCQGIHGKGF